MTATKADMYEPSTLESQLYYFGLPSKPVLVARPGAVWQAPVGLEAYAERKELVPIGNHVDLMAFQMRSGHYWIRRVLIGALLI